LTNPGQAFQLEPNDACKDQRFVSPSAIQHINASVGQPEGLPKPVASVDSISSLGYGPPLGFDPGPPASIQCYETLTFDDGTQKTGILELINETDGLAIIWTPEPPPISPQQAARDTLAEEQYESDTESCDDEYNYTIGQMTNLFLEAQANGTPFDSQAYVRNATQTELQFQKAASKQYQSSLGGQP